MSDQNKETLIRWFEEVWNRGRREVISSAGLRHFFDRMHAAFSGIHVTPEEVVADGNLACLRWSVTMKHKRR